MLPEYPGFGTLPPINCISPLLKFGNHKLHVNADNVDATQSMFTFMPRLECQVLRVAIGTSEPYDCKRQRTRNVKHHRNSHENLRIIQFKRRESTLRNGDCTVKRRVDGPTVAFKFVGASEQDSCSWGKFAS